MSEYDYLFKILLIGKYSSNKLEILFRFVDKWEDKLNNNLFGMEIVRIILNIGIKNYKY